MSPEQNKTLARRFLAAIRKEWSPAVVEGDKIAEEWGGLDVASVLHQLGALRA